MKKVLIAILALLVACTAVFATETEPVVRYDEDPNYALNFAFQPTLSRYNAMGQSGLAFQTRLDSFFSNPASLSKRGFALSLPSVSVTVYNLEKMVNDPEAVDIFNRLIKGQTEGELLVKGIALDQFGGDNPDSANIQNSAGEDIVPGSSFKGAIRSRMSSIAKYLSGSNKEQLITDAFGKKGNGKDDPGKTGDLRFFDTIIGNKTDNDKMSVRNRIRIDKFTGGVMYKGKFTEKNISGKFDIKIMVKDTKTSEKSAGGNGRARNGTASH